MFMFNLNDKNLKPFSISKIMYNILRVLILNFLQGTQFVGNSDGS